ncbi:MAG TPA: class I SAM-dependent methyltransferase [Dehalococcoidia bacterium]|nr:class I SAM-dependent methyltransferase [Dehalococcoidia bacterium]
MAVEQTDLRAGFDAEAEAFERTRPVCPAALFADLVALAGLAPGDRVLEIGCGSGQATLPLAERGLAVTALELGPNLAALARRRLQPYATVEVVTGAFEDWQPHGRRLAAVVAVNALHWVEPALRYAKPAALLAPGGALVVAGCHWAQPHNAEPFWREVQADYRAVGYAGEPPPAPETIGPWHLPPEAAPYFEETAARRYPPFQVAYSAGDYLALLATQSGTRALDAARQREFLDRVRLRLRDWPQVTATFVPFLTVGARLTMASGA